MIQDEGGSFSTLTRKTLQRANQAGLDEVWCRSIASDGEMADFLSDGQPIDPDCIVKTGLPRGVYDLKKKISPPTKKGSLVHWELSYNLLNAFPTSRESLVHFVKTQTELLTLVVQFPPNRPAMSAVLWEGYGDSTKTRLQTVSGGRQISARVENPKLGGQYSLDWNW